MQIEEAIEIMNNFIKDTPKAPFECLMNKEVEAVETLLNEIETMHSEFDRLEGIEDNTAMLKYELEKKDKVIDVMAEWINKQDIDEEICKNNITQPELCNEEGTNCRHCIKEYFYKKVQK